jgi:hypothetical protein
MDEFGKTGSCVLRRRPKGIDRLFDGAEDGVPGLVLHLEAHRVAKAQEWRSRLPRAAGKRLHCQ